MTLIFTAFCFIWWADQLYRHEKETYALKIQSLSTEQQAAQFLIESQSASNKSPSVILTSIKKQFPNLQVALENDQIHLSMNEGLIAKWKEERDHALLRLLFMGSFFLILLVIAFAWIYRSLNKAIALNQQQNNFLLAVTHELKTPVAGMKLMWETLKRPIAQEQKDKLIEQGVKENERMVELIDNILMATRMEADDIRFQKEIVNLIPIIRSYCERALSINTKDQQFELKIPVEAMVNGDLISIKLVIHNLIENAVKYAPESSLITVDLQAQKGQWELQVKDQGLGIPDKDKQKIFQKFYRLGDESTRNTKGTGLGLYLVKEIIQRHAGKVWVKDNQPTGSIFHLIIPNYET